jgi:hypothetical protein
MRYRILSPEGDYTFGRGKSEFLVNTPEAVAQAVGTRLKLLTGEWFLDQEEGTPYSSDILGNNTSALYDQAIQQRIIGTQGVVEIEAYTSTLNNRNLTVDVIIKTLYGTTQLQQVI